MQTYQFGQTRLGLPILAHDFGASGSRILILGGVHGNEPEGVVCAHGLLKKAMEEFPFALQLTLVPSFNLDGVLRKTRGNGTGVDLNRNLPTKDWTSEAKKPEYQPGPFANSEPENQALVKWIENFQPAMIWSLHSWKPMLNVNGDCRPEAEVVKELTGYEIHEDIGYPTPGCLGTYTGLEKNIPTLTYEIERGLDEEATLRIHVPAIWKALKVSEKRFK
jgi:murein peptide amidase A